MTELPMSKAIEMVRDLRDRRGINKQQEQYLLDFEVNYQTWVEGICQLGQWRDRNDMRDIGLEMKLKDHSMKVTMFGLLATSMDLTKH